MKHFILDSCLHKLLLIVLVKICTSRTDGDHRESSDDFILLTSSFSGYNTTAVISSVNSALAHINSSPSLYGNLSLSYSTVLDSMCNRRYTAEILRSYLSDKKPLAIIGCGCSTATEAIADVVLCTNHTSSLPVISYGSPSAKLSNSTLYPSLFRTIPTWSRISDAVVQFILLFNWKQVLLFSEGINFNLQELNNLMTENSIKLSVLNNTSDELFLTDNRVLILDTYAPTAIEFLCEAFYRKVYYPGFAWIIVDNFINNDWYIGNDIDTNCTVDEIQRVLNYSIMIGTSPNNQKENISLYAYDAVLSLAIAINKNRDIQETSLTEVFTSMVFEGLSGRISWNYNGDRNNTTIIFTQLLQDFNESGTLLESVIGYYQEDNLNIFNPDQIWPLGIPSDGIPVIVVLPVDLWAFIAAIIMCLGGLVWVYACFIFMWANREEKLIKLTSPKLNYVIFLGSSSVFLSVILYSYPSTQVEVLKFICPIQPVLLSIFGYNLCATVATIKLWRICYIFKNPHKNKKIPKDLELLIVIAILTAVYFVLVIALIIPDAILFPPSLAKGEKNDSVDPITGEIKTFYYLDCRTRLSPFARVFFGVVVTHALIVHGTGLFLAFRIRKIRFSILNEYKYNLAYIVCSVILLVIFVILARISIIGSDPSLYAFFISIFTSASCFLFLGLTFIPKMVALKKDPSGEKLFGNPVGDIADAIPRDKNATSDKA